MSLKHSILAGTLFFAASQSAGAVTINFDYSYDGGFFSNASRRAVLETAGNYLGSILSDKLASISSSGNNHFDAIFSRPDTGSDMTLTDFNVASDALTVFVGGRAFSGNTLGEGGYGGFNVSGSQQFVNDVLARGQSGATQGSTATDFAPWGGQIAFNTSSNWYFDNDTSTTEAFSGSDFYSVALHELAHLLGFGTSDAWSNQISNGKFTGTNAVAAYGSNVPLTSAQGHWASGTSSWVNGVPQEAAMDPSLTAGTRKVLTDLDLAGLKDVGWQVGVTAVPVPSAVWLFGSALLGFAGFKRRQSAAA